MTAREQQLACIAYARANGPGHYRRMFIGYARMWGRHVVAEARARRLAETVNPVTPPALGGG